MKISLGLGEIALGATEGMGLTLDELVVEAQAAERDGFHGAYLANINGLDAMTACAVIGRATTRIQLGTGVVPTYPRHPVAMAQQALSVQAATGNRFHLGIGLSHQIVIENMLGLSYDKPFSHMRDYLAVLAPLIRSGVARVKNDSFKVNSYVSVAGAKPCPILIAALAPKMLALAGREADGTVTWMVGARTLREHVVPTITAAAAEAGRPAPAVVVSLPVAVHADEAEARRAAAERFAIYGQLPAYRRMLDREGADQGPGTVAVVGTADRVREQLAAIRDAGATELVAACFPVGADRAGSLQGTRAVLKGML
jgi:5,10-methylenetetrahydromethanopterin reductase